MKKLIKELHGTEFKLVVHKGYPKFTVIALVDQEHGISIKPVPVDDAERELYIKVLMEIHEESYDEVMKRIDAPTYCAVQCDPPLSFIDLMSLQAIIREGTIEALPMSQVEMCQPVCLHAS